MQESPRKPALYQKYLGVGRAGGAVGFQRIERRASRDDLEDVEGEQAFSLPLDFTETRTGETACPTFQPDLRHPSAVS